MAVHDPDAAEEEVARAAGARKAASGEDVGAAPDVAAVVIATPTDRPAAGIEAAARAGKAIFCEEPIDLDPDRARACIEVVRETGARLMVGLSRRFDPDFAEVRRQIDACAIGDVELVQITFVRPGAVRRRRRADLDDTGPKDAARVRARGRTARRLRS